jgi:hypothetical protein
LFQEVVSGLLHLELECEPGFERCIGFNNIGKSIVDVFGKENNFVRVFLDASSDSRMAFIVRDLASEGREATVLVFLLAIAIGEAC